MDHLDSVHMAFVLLLMYFLNSKTFLRFNIIKIKMLKSVSTFNGADKFLSLTTVIHSIVYLQIE